MFFFGGGRGEAEHFVSFYKCGMKWREKKRSPTPPPQLSKEETHLCTYKENSHPHTGALQAESTWQEFKSRFSMAKLAEIYMKVVFKGRVLCDVN